MKGPRKSDWKYKSQFETTIESMSHNSPTTLTSQGRYPPKAVPDGELAVINDNKGFLSINDAERMHKPKKDDIYYRNKINPVKNLNITQIEKSAKVSESDQERALCSYHACAPLCSHMCAKIQKCHLCNTKTAEEQPEKIQKEELMFEWKQGKFVKRCHVACAMSAHVPSYSYLEGVAGYSDLDEAEQTDIKGKLQGEIKN